MQLKSALYMIPVGISDGDFRDIFPPSNSIVLKAIRHFIVENVRTARRFLKKIDKEIDISQLTFYELNGHTSETVISSYLDALRSGEPIGVLSEAGCPGVADPGASVVRIAQEENLRVIPLVGPSSILLSLMASGLNGQRFAFQGYLPVKEPQRIKAIHEFEQQSRRLDMTQIFIETPYRNEKLMESFLKHLGGETLLCVASDITNPQEEKIITKKVKQWKKDGFRIPKVPSIFLFYSIGN